MAARNHSTFQQAKAYAFLLLKFRPRSEFEITDSLKKKEFDAVHIQETVDFLKKHLFINDELFAKLWIGSRLKKPYGLRRIAQELKQKGIKQEVIYSSIEESGAQGEEQETVLALARQKWRAYKSLEPKTARQRMYGFLLRRGFSADMVIEAIHQL